MQYGDLELSLLQAQGFCRWMLLLICLFKNYFSVMCSVIVTDQEQLWVQSGSVYLVLFPVLFYWVLSGALMTLGDHSS